MLGAQITVHILDYSASSETCDYTRNPCFTILGGQHFANRLKMPNFAPRRGAFDLLVSLFCRSLGYAKAFRLLRSRRSLRSLRSLRSRRSLRIAVRTTIAVVIAVPWRVPGVLKPFPSYSACKGTPWDHLSVPRNPVFPHFHVAHVEDAGGAGDHPAGVPIALGPLPSYSAC